MTYSDDLCILEMLIFAFKCFMVWISWFFNTSPTGSIDYTITLTFRSPVV